MEHKDKDHKDKDKKDKHKRDKSSNKDSVQSADVGDILSKQTDIVHNLKLEDTTCDFVTVYSDRAEITRTLKVNIEKEGKKLRVMAIFKEFI